MSYVLSLPGVSTVVIGCSSPDEVDQNAEIAREFEPLDESAIRAIEQHTAPYAGYFTSYKK
jgi:predicted aldo/keto reductase-like oxidoreductase